MAHEVDTNKLKHLSYPENTRSAVLYKELTLAVYHHVSLCIFTYYVMSRGFFQMITVDYEERFGCLLRNQFVFNFYPLK